MKFEMSYLYFFIAAIVIYFMYKHFSSKSSFTTQPFPDTLSATDAQALYTSQSTALASELSTALSNAIQAKKTTQELINIAWQYADMSNQLNKDFAAYKIRQIPASPAPAPM